MYAFTFNHLPLLLHRFAWIFGIFLVGYAVRAEQLWPHNVIRDGTAAFVDLQTHFKSYLGLFATRAAKYRPGTDSGVTLNDSARIAPGNVFIAGLINKKNVMLLLAPDGRELHRWRVPFKKAVPDLGHVFPKEIRPLNESMAHIHGVHVFPDGSVVFNYDFNGLVSIDACSNIKWSLPRMTHHAVTAAEDGTLWVISREYHTQSVARLPLLSPPFYEDQLLQISRAGQVLRTISVPEVFFKNGLYALHSASGRLDATNAYEDFTHTNDIELLTVAKAKHFPDFKAGDILLSMRNLNLLMVIDQKTEKVKWHRVGPWLRQHDPDFLSDGTISVYDNRWNGEGSEEIIGGSRIINIDPKNMTVRTAYKTNPDQPLFASNVMGVHQTMPNGNILITQPTHGRVFEVTAGGEIVWEYINRLSNEYLGYMTVGHKYNKNYFQFPLGKCNREAKES